VSPSQIRLQELPFKNLKASDPHRQVPAEEVKAHPSDTQHLLIGNHHQSQVVPDEHQASTCADSIETRDLDDHVPQNVGVNAKPVPIVTEDGQEEWLIDSIVEERIRGRKMQYRVRWFGYGPEDDSWLPAHELSDCEALDKWDAQ
jgi:hypothetical protein